MQLFLYSDSEIYILPLFKGRGAATLHYLPILVAATAVEPFAIEYIFEIKH